MLSQTEENRVVSPASNASEESKRSESSGDNSSTTELVRTILASLNDNDALRKNLETYFRAILDSVKGIENTIEELEGQEKDKKVKKFLRSVYVVTNCRYDDCKNWLEINYGSSGETTEVEVDDLTRSAQIFNRIARYCDGKINRELEGEKEPDPLWTSSYSLCVGDNRGEQQKEFEDNLAGLIAVFLQDNIEGYVQRKYEGKYADMKKGFGKTDNDVDVPSPSVRSDSKSASDRASSVSPTEVDSQRSS